MHAIHIIQTLTYFCAALLISAICGYGVLTLLVTEELEEYRFVLMIPFGYAFFGWVTYLLSGNFELKLPVAALTTFFGSLILGVVAARYKRLDTFKSASVRLLKALSLGLPITIVMLWPLFWMGADTFLSANNPDWFASFVDNYFLLHNSVRGQTAHGIDTHQIIQSMAGHMPPSARFSSGFFAILLELLLRISSRTALSLSVGFFVFCIPLSVYFMSRAVFGLSKRGAWIASTLIGLSAPTAMSFVYYYVGQNSGLGVLPAALAVGYIFAMRPNWKSMLLAAALVGSLLVMYMGMLPYAMAPIGALVLYRLIRREYSVKEVAMVLGGIPAVILIANLGMLPYIKAMLLGWANIVGQTLQGQYFLDFLTEHFFVVFFGVTNYPVYTAFQDGWLTGHGLPTLPVFYVLTGISCAIMLAFAFLWGKSNWKGNRYRVIAGASAALIYGYVWYSYTFNRQYGYAVFKMCAWLQFLLVVPYAYGFDRIWATLRSDRIKGALRPALAAFGVFAVVLVAGSNLLSTTRYTTFSLGNNTDAKMINNYGFSSNVDYLDLAENVSRFVPKDQSIGLIFPDSILNFWAAYYLKEFNLSMLSHVNMPGDDENLPDILSRRVTDYYGNVRVDKNPHFHDDADDFYLMTSSGNPNQDLATYTGSAQPLWENKTFRLYRAADVKDLLFTGRGFYRAEYNRPEQIARAEGYWVPKMLRFAAEGGEFYFLRPSQPTKPYRFSFTAFVGVGNQSSSRTIELWLNGKKFDEQVINEGLARVISNEFIPAAGVNRIVARVVERTQPLARPAPLWNSSVPLDYRRTNLAVTDARVILPDALSKPHTAPPHLAGNDLINHALSFNGMDRGRWVGKRSSFNFVAPLGTKELILEATIPEGAKLPYQIDAQVNGRLERWIAKAPGPVKFVSSVVPRENQVRLDLKTETVNINPSGRVGVPDEMQGFRLDSVTLN